MKMWGKMDSFWSMNCIYRSEWAKIDALLSSTKFWKRSLFWDFFIMVLREFVFQLEHESITFYHYVRKTLLYKEAAINGLVLENNETLRVLMSWPRKRCCALRATALLRRFVSTHIIIYISKDYILLKHGLQVANFSVLNFINFSSKF